MRLGLFFGFVNKGGGEDGWWCNHGVVEDVTPALTISAGAKIVSGLSGPKSD